MLRGVLLVTAAAAMWTALPVPRAMAQQDFSAVEIQTVPVSDGIYALIGAGGNVGLAVGEDGALLVDTQYAPLSGKIRAAVAKLTGLDVSFVVNTHWHGDHTGGNQNFSDIGAVILAHDNVRNRLSREVFLPLFDSRTPAAPESARPGLTYADETTLHWNGETVRVMHMPNAHTDGDSIVHFVTANVIHAGDILWTSGYPRIDSDQGGGSLGGMLAAIDRIRSLANGETRLIPGHGPLPEQGVAFLDEYQSMLTTIGERVEGLIMQGSSEDEVVAAKPTQDYDARWGNGYMNAARFVRVVFRSLNR